MTTVNKSVENATYFLDEMKKVERIQKSVCLWRHFKL